MKKTKLREIGKIQSDAGVTVDGEHNEVVEYFKYIGSLKSTDGNCSKEIRSRIGIAKKIKLDLERQVNKESTENETNALAVVDSSHIWRRRPDSHESL